MLPHVCIATRLRAPEHGVCCLRTQCNVHTAVKALIPVIKMGYTFKEAVTHRGDVRYAIKYLHEHTLAAFSTLMSHGQTQTLFAMQVLPLARPRRASSPQQVPYPFASATAFRNWMQWHKKIKRGNCAETSCEDQ